MTPEGKVKERIIAKLKALKQNGDKVFWQSMAGSQYGTAGIDLFICYYGIFIGIELKRYDKQGKVTTRQQLILSDIFAAGGISRLIDSEGAEDELFSFVLPMLKIECRNRK